MPFAYAHYRFGAELIGSLPPEIQRTVHRFRQLYDVGLHGPDVLYYHDPVIPTGTVRLCDKFHAQTGQVFFERVARALRMNPSDGARAYLYGLLAHYTLDSLTSPYAIRKAEEKQMPIALIWGCFDRYLLEQDGKTPPCQADQSGHIQLTPGECQTAAMFYPGVSPSALGKGVKNMAKGIKSFAGARGSRRQAMLNTAARLTPRMAELAVPAHPDHRLAAVNADLDRLFQIGLERYPLLLEQLRIHLRRKTPLGPDFNMSFR